MVSSPVVIAVAVVAVVAVAGVMVYDHIQNTGSADGSEKEVANPTDTETPAMLSRTKKPSGANKAEKYMSQTPAAGAIPPDPDEEKERTSKMNNDPDKPESIERVETSKHSGRPHARLRDGGTRGLDPERPSHGNPGRNFNPNENQWLDRWGYPQDPPPATPSP